MSNPIGRPSQSLDATRGERSGDLPQKPPHPRCVRVALAEQRERLPFGWRIARNLNGDFLLCQEPDRTGARQGRCAISLHRGPRRRLFTDDQEVKVAASRSRSFLRPSPFVAWRRRPVKALLEPGRRQHLRQLFPAHPGRPDVELEEELEDLGTHHATHVLGVGSRTEGGRDVGRQGLREQLPVGDLLRFPGRERLLPATGRAIERRTTGRLRLKPLPAPSAFPPSPPRSSGRFRHEMKTLTKLADGHPAAR